MTTTNTPAPAATEAPSDDMQINGKPATAHSILAALVDIHDDEVSAPPEHRCYIPSAYSDTLDMARRFLAVGECVQPVQASLSDEQMTGIARVAHAEGRMSWAGFKEDADGKFTIPVLSAGHVSLVRAVLAALASSTPTQPLGAATPKEAS